MNVNHVQPGETMIEFHGRVMAGYTAEKIVPAVTYLRESVILPSDVDTIHAAIVANPEAWWAPYHFYAGMAIRNRLRNGGFGEEYWPIWNLDDIWVPLVELAVDITLT